MLKIKLPVHVHSDVDRHGNRRIYFRRALGQRKIRITEKPGTAAFYKVYGKLLAGDGAAAVPLTAKHLRATGYIYFLMANAQIKIGFSVGPTSRVQSLKGGMPVKIDGLIVVPGTKHDEQLLHEQLHRYRLDGEWFKDVRTVRMVAIRSIAFGKPMHTNNEQNLLTSIGSSGEVRI